MAELPSVDRLGYALDLAHIDNISDLATVHNEIIWRRRLLSIDFDNARELEINGIHYSVPNDVSVTIDNKIPQEKYISFPNGKDAASAFAADVSYHSRYFAVSGSSSADYVARKSFLESNQYAFFSYAEGSYSSQLDYARSLVEAPLINGLIGVPKTFDASNASTVKKYRHFFREYGSHIIYGINNGSRYTLQVWAPNNHEAVNKMYDADVKAMFNGIPSNGNFDPSVKPQHQYKLFAESFQFLVSILGGDPSGWRKLRDTDGTYYDFQAWTKSIKEEHASLVTFQVVDVWTLMKFAESPVLRSYADPLYAAFMWMVNNPNVYNSLDDPSDEVGDTPIAAQ